MSVFSAIKGKLVTVKQDLSDSIHLPFLSSKQEKANSSHQRSSVTDKATFNAHAGAELLSQYQLKWSEIHSLTDENARKAQELDNVVGSIYSRLEKEHTAVNDFMAESLMLSSLVEQLSASQELISTLEGTFKDMESMLATLEDTCDGLQQKKNTVEHEYQLTRYKQRKNIELEQTKVELARKHASKVREYEEQLNKTLRERQKVFEEAFREQMQSYKKAGKLDVTAVPVSQRLSSNTADEEVILAEIAVENDNSQLDSFLHSAESNTEVTSEISTTTSSSLLSCDNVTSATSVSPQTEVPDNVTQLSKQLTDNQTVADENKNESESSNDDNPAERQTASDNN